MGGSRNPNIGAQVGLGRKGPRGDSAYEVAVLNGYTGSQEQWLLSLKGDAIVGARGTKGQSAYYIAVQNGFEGTEGQWLQSLKSTLVGPQGEQGERGLQGSKGDTGEVGPTGNPGSTGAQGKQGNDGQRGLSGEKGDKGDKGNTGDTGSKGDSFVYEDFTTEQLTALKGEKGDEGPQGQQGVQGAASTVPGPKGDPGDPGLQGLQGLQGLKGDKGDDGPTGTAGSDASVTKVNVEAVLTGKIDTHTHPIITTVTFVLSAGTPSVVGLNKTNAIIISQTCIATKVSAICKIAPTGAALIFDINYNGTTIWTNQANRISIADGQTSASQTSIDVVNFVEGGVLTIDIDQVGSTIAGQDITIQLKMVI